MALCPKCKKTVYMNSDNYCGNCGSPLGDVTEPTLVGPTFQEATIPLEAAVRSNQTPLPLEGQAGDWLLTALLVRNYTGAQATGKGSPAKTAASAASMECPCLCIVDR